MFQQLCKQLAAYLSASFPWPLGRNKHPDIETSVTLDPPSAACQDRRVLPRVGGPRRTHRAGYRIQGMLLLPSQLAPTRPSVPVMMQRPVPCRQAHERLFRLRPLNSWTQTVVFAPRAAGLSLWVTFGPSRTLPITIQTL